MVDKYIKIFYNYKNTCNSFVAFLLLYIEGQKRGLLMNEIKELVVRSKSGDAKAFAQLYDVYANDLYRFAYYYLGTKEDAQDAVQDAVCEAYRAINSLKKEEAFKSWLFKILSNCCKKQISKAIAVRTLTTDISVETFLDIAELSDALALKSELTTLEEQEREIVLLCIVCGYKSKEVAQILSVPSATVRSKLSRTLLKLRKKLEEDQNEKAG